MCEHVFYVKEVLILTLEKSLGKNEDKINFTLACCKSSKPPPSPLRDPPGRGSRESMSSCTRHWIG